MNVRDNPVLLLRVSSVVDKDVDHPLSGLLDPTDGRVSLVSAPMPMMSLEIQLKQEKEN